MNEFAVRQGLVRDEHEKLLAQENARIEPSNGIYFRYENPVLTADHAPLEWRYDFDESSNPFFMERMGINAVFNAGAILFRGRHLVMARVEGWDRKSFFAIAESKNGTDGFRFWDEPIDIADSDTPATNLYDPRLTAHEDGYVYAIFCAERKDPDAPESDTSSAVAAAGIMRSKDMKSWKRLPDLVTPSPQQRNVVLHPKFVDGKYMLYTRPQDGFISTGSGGGIAWGLSDSMDGAKLEEEKLIDPRVYHTIKEVKNGAGAPPIETDDGWLHIAHGVRNTAAGLRYVLYAFLCDKNEPWKVSHAPGGHLIAPIGSERVGDVSNVVFSNGLIEEEDGRVLLYYASSDTRLHVAETSVEQLLDYVKNTPEDGLTSHASVKQRLSIIRKNKKVLGN